MLQLGIPPATTAELERGLEELQGFLGGEDVELEGGAQVRMSWIGTTHSTKVPVSVAATGPRTIAAGARHAERVDFTVGADPRRISWAVGEARRATQEGEDVPSLGAFVNFAVNADAAVA